MCLANWWLTSKIRDYRNCETIMHCEMSLVTKSGDFHWTIHATPWQLNRNQFYCWAASAVVRNSLDIQAVWPIFRTNFRTFRNYLRYQFGNVVCGRDKERKKKKDVEWHLEKEWHLHLMNAWNGNSLIIGICRIRYVQIAVWAVRNSENALSGKRRDE